MRRIPVRTIVGLLVMAGCGGTSVRGLEGDSSTESGRAGVGGGTSNAASGGMAQGGGAGMRVHPTPSLCAVLQSALDAAKRCTAEADCGQVVDGWPCTLPDGLPPIVNREADVSDLPELFAQAASMGECSLVTYGCDNCTVDGYGCIAGRCEWRDVNCGPPP